VNPTSGDNSLNRRQALRLLGVAGAGALAAACAGPGSGSGSGQSTTAAASTTGSVGGKISFAHWRGEDREVFDKIIKDFTAKHAGTSVRQDISPSQDYQRMALQQIKGGSSGDVFTAFRGAQFTDMSKAGIFVPFDGKPVVKNYKADFIEPGQSDGKQLGFPYQLVLNMPLCNADLLEKAGNDGSPPKDWDSYLGLLDKLKGLGVVALLFPGGSPADYNQLMHSMVMNNAPSDDMFTKIESGEYKCTDDWFITTLKQYQQLSAYFQPNATGTSAEAGQQMLATGKAAMMVTGSYYVTVVRKLGAKFPLNVLAPITVSADKVKYVGIHNTTFILGVNSAGKNQATAAAFVDYLSDPTVAGVYANGTAQHVTVENVDYTDPDLNALSPWLKRKTLLAPLFQFQNLDIRGAVQNAALEVVSGKSPEQAAEEAQRVVDQKRA
jgi:raffinose/stachyose/melibiose transport system substrate-binding protein